jgi:hypothetical protein
VETDQLLKSFVFSPLIIKPPVPLAGENADDESGTSVSTAGDVNGDGLDDLIVSARRADPSGKLSAGKSYVIFGKIDSTAINLSAIDLGTGGFVINLPVAQGGLSLTVRMCLVSEASQSPPQAMSTVMAWMI